MSESLTSNERAIKVALTELVRLRDLRTDADAINTSGDWNAVHRQRAMFAEYQQKIGGAWDAARRALTDDPYAPETTGWLTDAQCDDVIEFLTDYEWQGLTRENVRTWDRAISETRGTQETSACSHDTASARGNPGDLEIYCVKCCQVLRASENGKGDE